MNQKERDRLQMLGRVKDKQMTLNEASQRLGLSYRQTRRLWRRYVEVGDAGLVHRLRGRPSNNGPVADVRREQALSLYREHYAGFGPTLAAEQLAQRDGLAVDHETLRGWLIQAGLWKVGHDRSRGHRRWRPRRACFGQLVQFDGSDHAWFGPDRPRCTLMVMVDDATNWTWAEFHEAETVRAAMSVLRGWVERHGLPQALYPDRHSIHRRNDRQAEDVFHRTGKRPLTQFGRALAELDVAMTCAYSPQAKGRVERTNGTLQDRLVKLLALEGITTIASANAYLQETYLPQHNTRFAIAPQDAQDAHRPAPSAEQLSAALCLKDQRTVGRDHCVQYRGQWFQIEAGAALPRRQPRVEVREHLDGQVQLWAKGRQLPCTQLTQRPRQPQAKPDLVARVDQHQPSFKPPKDHPWRRRLADSDSAPSPAAAATGGGALRSGRTRCARPPCATAPTPGKGTVLLS